MAVEALALPAVATIKVEEPRIIPRRSVASWVLYDLANTCFSLGVVTLYFPQLLERVFGYAKGTDVDGVVGGLASLAAAVVFILAPILGAISDQAARRLPFLAVSTVACVAATFVLAQSTEVLTFALFVVAVVCFQAGLIFYDSLLPEVSTDENRGRIGGIGVGVGYMGSLLAYVIGTVLLNGKLVERHLPQNGLHVVLATPGLDDYTAVFRGIALGFLVFAIPAFIFVRERPRVAPPISWRVAPMAFSQLAATARHARRYRGLLPFLIGRMFYADAANTLIVMVVLYASGALRMTYEDAGSVAILSIVAAIPAGLAWGRVVDRFGPKRTLDVVLVGWMAIFALVAAIPTVPLPTWLIYPAGAGVGVALAGLWASDRPLMARLAPPRYYGQFFGLYSMVGRFGAIVGPLTWGIIVTTLGWGQPAAVMFLFAWVAIAFLVLRRVDDAPRAWAPEDLPELAPEPAG
jgi:UMF1 family MFS transporter